MTDLALLAFAVAGFALWKMLREDHPMSLSSHQRPHRGATDTLPLLVLAAVLIAAGLAAVLLSRKPHHRRTT